MRNVVKSVLLTVLFCAGLVSASAYAQIDWKQAQGTRSGS